MNLENFSTHEENEEANFSTHEVNEEENEEQEEQEENSMEPTKKKFLSELFSKMITLITTALSVCVALAWNDAFQNFFKKNPILNSYDPLLYVLVITEGIFHYFVP